MPLLSPVVLSPLKANMICINYKRGLELTARGFSMPEIELSIEKTSKSSNQMDLNSLDLMSDFSLNKLSKEPGMLALSGTAATILAGTGKTALDSFLYMDYNLPRPYGDPLLSMNKVSKAPEWFYKGAMPWLEKQFEASAATAGARQASVDYLASKAGLAQVQTAVKASLEAPHSILKVFGRSGSQMLFGASDSIGLRNSLLNMDSATLQSISSKMGEFEAGIVKDAHKAVKTEVALLANKAQLQKVYDRSLNVLAKPAESAVMRTWGKTVADGAIAVGANLALDYGAKALADSICGDNSRLGRVMESNAVGLGLSTFGYIAGSDMRSKLAYAGAGWLAGKAFNYLSMPEDKLSIGKVDLNTFKPQSALLSSYGVDRLSGK